MNEKKLSSKLIYNGFIKVYHDEVVLEDGTKAVREYLKHPGAALMVPVLTNGNFLMIKQFRYAVGQEFLEFPAGKRDGNEESIACAHRELEEEIGYRANSMSLMTRIHPAIGYCDEWIDLYVATDLTKTQTKLDRDERIDVTEVTPAELEKKIWAGELTDVKTQIAAYWALKLSAR